MAADYEFAWQVSRWEADLLTLILQCAYIEAHWGDGPEAAMRWITTQLEDSEAIPTDARNTDDWWDAHYRPAPTPPEAT